MWTVGDTYEQRWTQKVVLQFVCIGKRAGKGSRRKMASQKQQKYAWQYDKCGGRMLNVQSRGSAEAKQRQSRGRAEAEQKAGVVCEQKLSQQPCQEGKG